MALANPLETLGVSREVVAYEMNNDSSLKSLMRTAESMYKALGKLYHPDTGGGVELMTAFTAAIEELRKDGALQYYAGRLVSLKEVRKRAERLQAHSSVVQHVQRDTRALRAVSQVVQCIDQYRVLGIDRPTSYIGVIDDNMRVVVDVHSPSEARIRALAIGTEDPPVSGTKFRYQDGVWQEMWLQKTRQQWFRLSEFTLHQSVAVVGFLVKDDIHAVQAGGAGLHEAIEASSRRTLEWLEPERCWFLPHLRSGADTGVLGDVELGMVLNRGGRFSLVDVLCGHAPIKD